MCLVIFQIDKVWESYLRFNTLFSSVVAQMCESEQNICAKQISIPYKILARYTPQSSAAKFIWWLNRGDKVWKNVLQVWKSCCNFADPNFFAPAITQLYF